MKNNKIYNNSPILKGLKDSSFREELRKMTKEDFLNYINDVCERKELVEQFNVFIEQVTLYAKESKNEIIIEFVNALKNFLQPNVKESKDVTKLFSIMNEKERPDFSPMLDEFISLFLDDLYLLIVGIMPDIFYVQFKRHEIDDLIN